MRSCRRKEAEPNSCIQTRKSRLRNSRNVRRCRKTALGRNRVGLERARTHMRQRRPGIEQRHVDATLRQILDGRASAAIRHQTKACAGFPLKEYAGNMGTRADRKSVV